MSFPLIASTNIYVTLFPGLYFSKVKTLPSGLTGPRGAGCVGKSGGPLNQPSSLPVAASHLRAFKDSRDCWFKRYLPSLVYWSVPNGSEAELREVISLVPKLRNWGANSLPNMASVLPLGDSEMPSSKEIFGYSSNLRIALPEAMSHSAVPTEVPE